MWADPRGLSHIGMAALLCLLFQWVGSQVTIIPHFLQVEPQVGLGLGLCLLWGPAGLAGWCAAELAGGLIGESSVAWTLFRFFGILLTGLTVIQARPNQEKISPVKFLCIGTSAVCVLTAWIALGVESIGQYPFDYYALILFLHYLAGLVLFGLPAYLWLQGLRAIEPLVPDEVRPPLAMRPALLLLGPVVLILGYFICRGVTLQPVFKAPVVGWSGGWGVRAFVAIGLLVHLVLILCPWWRTEPEGAMKRRGLDYRSLLK